MFYRRRGEADNRVLNHDECIVIVVPRLLIINRTAHGARNRSSTAQCRLAPSLGVHGVPLAGRLTRVENTDSGLPSHIDGPQKRQVIRGTSAAVTNISHIQSF